jgi:hypothetical protein
VIRGTGWNFQDTKRDPETLCYNPEYTSKFWLYDYLVNGIYPNIRKSHSKFIRKSLFSAELQGYEYMHHLKYDDGIISSSALWELMKNIVPTNLVCEVNRLLKKSSKQLTEDQVYEIETRLPCTRLMKAKGMRVYSNFWRMSAARYGLTRRELRVVYNKVYDVKLDHVSNRGVPIASVDAKTICHEAIELNNIKVRLVNPPVTEENVANNYADLRFRKSLNDITAEEVLGINKRVLRVFIDDVEVERNLEGAFKLYLIAITRKMGKYRLTDCISFDTFKLIMEADDLRDFQFSKKYVYELRKWLKKGSDMTLIRKRLKSYCCAVLRDEMKSNCYNSRKLGRYKNAIAYIYKNLAAGRRVNLENLEDKKIRLSKGINVAIKEALRTGKELRYYTTIDNPVTLSDYAREFNYRNRKDTSQRPLMYRVRCFKADKLKKAVTKVKCGVELGKEVPCYEEEKPAVREEPEVAPVKKIEEHKRLSRSHMKRLKFWKKNPGARYYVGGCLYYYLDDGTENLYPTIVYKNKNESDESEKIKFEERRRSFWESYPEKPFFIDTSHYYINDGSNILHEYHPS